MFCVGSRVRHNSSEDGRRTYRPNCCEYNNEDGYNSLNILREKDLSSCFTRLLELLMDKKIDELFNRTGDNTGGPVSIIINDRIGIKKKTEYVLFTRIEGIKEALVA